MRYLKIILSIDYFNIELLHCEKEKNYPIYIIGNIITESPKLKLTLSSKQHLIAGFQKFVSAHAGRNLEFFILIGSL